MVNFYLYISCNWVKVYAFCFTNRFNRAMLIFYHFMYKFNEIISHIKSNSRKDA